MIVPIIYFAPLEDMRSISPEDRQTLLNNFHILMGRQLGNDFLLAIEPQRGTVRVQFALLPQTDEAVAMDTVAMVAREDPEKGMVIDTLASPLRSEEHTSELQSLMRNSYAVFCLKKTTERAQYSTPTD